MRNSNESASNLVFFLLGAACGAAIALLYAPVEGEKARQMIGEKAGDMKDKATDFTSNVAQTARDKYTDLTSKAQDILSRSQQAVSSAADSATDAMNGANR
jgi:gas vesicle protein